MNKPGELIKVVSYSKLLEKSNGRVLSIFSLSLSCVFLFLIGAFSFAEDGNVSSREKKRDPFVALVSPNGKIKSKEELFPRARRRPLSVNIALKAIVWDEKRPLVMINNKVYVEGNEIAAGLRIDKIYPDSIVINDNGNQVTIPLRKSPEK